MTEEEIEVIAEELAKIGGTSWYPGREQGPLLRLVSDRYREQARAVIVLIDRLRASRDAAVPQDNPGSAPHDGSERPALNASDHLRPGARVIYRPPGDRRAYPCQIVEIRGQKVYLAPVVRNCVGWIAMEYLLPSQPEKFSGTE